MTNWVQKLTLLLVGGALLAAAQPSAKAEFEVASIKQNNAGQRQYGFQFLAGRFVTTNLSLFVLIGIAYRLPVPNVPPGRLTGGPEWVRSGRYDVEGIPTRRTIMRQHLCSCASAMTNCSLAAPLG
jgi:hypothetical protein